MIKASVSVIKTKISTHRRDTCREFCHMDRLGSRYLKIKTCEYKGDFYATIDNPVFFLSWKSLRIPYLDIHSWLSHRVRNGLCKVSAKFAKLFGF